MPRKRPDHPNVIVFFTDQQRWDTSGLHGNPLDLMPNFDRMAREGTHVEFSFTCQPVCGPARSVLQTGKYATTTGCFRNGIPLPLSEVTLAHHFRKAGYKTGYIGKWHLADEEPVPEAKRGGYEYWLASNALEMTSDSYNCLVHDNDGRPVKLPGYRVDGLTDAAIRFVDRHQDDRFYLFLSFLEPHHQNHRDDFPAPDVYTQRYVGKWMPPDLAALGGSSHQHLGGYWGMVRRLDEALGRMLDALKSLDLAEDTVVLFTSDHGCHFKTRNAEYKRSCHDSSTRVPTALYGPGFFGGGQVRQLISLIDLPPTLLDAAQLPIPEEMHGHSILKLLHGSKEEWPGEMFIQISESQVGRSVRTRRWKYGVNAPDKNGNRDPRADAYEEQYLYDLQADPYELVNLIGYRSHQEVARVMQERLIKRMVAAGESAPTIRSAEPKAGGQRHVTPEEAHS